MDIDWLREIITSNEFFQGGALVAAFGMAVAWLRNAPRRIFEFLKRQFTVRMEVWNSNGLMFRTIETWLATIPYAAQARDVALMNRDYIDGYAGYSSRDTAPPYSSADIEDDNLDEVNDPDSPINGKSAFVTTPGPGFHWFFFKGRLILVNLYVDAQNSRTEFTRMKYDLTIIGRRPSLVLELMHNILAMRQKRPGVKVFEYRVRNGWMDRGLKSPRTMESVVQPAGVTEELLADMKAFLASEQWYRARGIPYRRGYMLDGPPGTGKSSSVLALGTALKMPVYVLGLGALEDDGDLNAAMMHIPKRAIMLMEDVDAAQHNRGVTRTATEGAAVKNARESGVTLSGLLNAIDGVSAAEDRILIMTTNYPDKIDSAILRSGRTDVRVSFSNLGRAEVARMFKLFFPDATVPHIPDGEYNPSALQGLFMRNKDTPSKIVFKPLDTEQKAA